MVDTIDDLFEQAISLTSGISNILSDYIDPYDISFPQKDMAESYKKKGKNVIEFFNVCGEVELDKITVLFMKDVRNSFLDLESCSRLWVYKTLDYTRAEIKKLVDSNDQDWKKDLKYLEPILQSNRYDCIRTLNNYGILKNYLPM